MKLSLSPRNKRALIRGSRTFLYFFITFIIVNIGGIKESLAHFVPAVLFPAVFAVILSALMAAEKILREVKEERREAKAKAGELNEAELERQLAEIRAKKEGAA